MPPSGSPAAERLAALAAAAGPDRQALVLAALEDETPLVREQAIRLATRYVEPEVLGALVADGVNAARRNGALAALERQGPYAVPYLVKLLASPDGELVMFALQILARIGDASASSGLLPLLQHPDPNVAQAAVEALGRLRATAAVPALLELLQGNLWLQLAAVTALGEIGDPAAVEPLLRLVPDSFVAEQSVRSLQRIAAPESLGPLLQLLARVHERPLRDAILEAVGVVLDLHPDPTSAGQDFAREAERDRGADGVSAFLGELLRTLEAEAECRRELLGNAADGAGADREALAQAAVGVILAGHLRSLYPLVLRRAADPELGWIETLWRRHAHLEPTELTGLLAHRDPLVRQGILIAGEFASEDVPALLARLGDPETSVRAAACRALGLVGDGGTAAALIDRVRRGTPDERVEAAGALGRLPVEALGELRSCLDPSAQAAAFEGEVLALAGSPSSAIRIAALRAAAVLPGTKADRGLFRGLADRDELVQVEALELLVQRGGDRTGATLTALLSAADSLRFRVIRALGQLRTADAVPKLESLYSEAALHERVEIVRALTAIAPAGITDFLGEPLRAHGPEMRHDAGENLGQLAGPADLKTVLEMAGHDDWALRNEAARALGRLGLSEGRAPLLTLVRDVEPVVARTARSALAGLTSGADSAAA